VDWFRVYPVADFSSHIAAFDLFIRASDALASINSALAFVILTASVITRSRESDSIALV
jgi:hypothetical protein